MNGKYYWYTPANGKRTRIKINSQPEEDGKQPFTMDDGTSGYLTPDEVKGLEEITEPNGANVANGQKDANDNQNISGGTAEHKPSEGEPQSTDYDGTGLMGGIDFSFLGDEAPGTTQLSDSDWLAGLTPDVKKRERSLKSKRAIDALNMVSQAVQVLGRMPYSNLGAGGAQPMAPNGYEKFMDRAYKQGMNYENVIAAREKILNAGKKLQQDYTIKKAKAQLESQKMQLLGMAQQARANKDEKAALYYEKQAEYKDAQIKAIGAGVDIKRSVAGAQIANYQNMIQNRNENTEIKRQNSENKGNKDDNDKLPGNGKSNKTPEEAKTRWEKNKVKTATY